MPQNVARGRLAQGDGIVELRLPNTRGIAGMVFTSGMALNIPYAYADPRFDPGLDDKTGFFRKPVFDPEGARTVLALRSKYGVPQKTLTDAA